MENLKQVISFDTVSALTVIAVGYIDIVLFVGTGRGFLGVSSHLSVLCICSVTLLGCPSPSLCILLQLSLMSILADWLIFL